MSVVMTFSSKRCKVIATSALYVPLFWEIGGGISPDRNVFVIFLKGAYCVLCGKAG